MTLLFALRRPEIELSGASLQEGSPEDSDVGSITIINGIGDYNITVSRASERLKVIQAIPAFSTPAALRVGPIESDFEVTPTFEVTITADNQIDPPIVLDAEINVSNFAVALADLSLNVSQILEDSAENTVVGTLQGVAEGSTLSLTDTAGSRFKVVGNKIFTGSVVTDYETTTTHNITVRETHAEGTNSPHDTVLAIEVVNVGQETRWGIPLIGTQTVVASGNITLTEPAGAAEGDLLVAGIAYRDTAAFTLPAGWSLVETQQSSGNTLSNTTAAITSMVMAYIIRGASAPALTFTRTAGNVAAGRIVSYNAAIDVAPYDTGSATTLAVAALDSSTPGITTAADGELLVAAVSVPNSANSHSYRSTSPSVQSPSISTPVNTTSPPLDDTWLERTDTGTTQGADVTLGFADAVKTTAGATGAFLASHNAIGRSVMIVAAFKKKTVSTIYGNVIVASAALQATVALQPALTDLRLTLGQMTATDFLTVNTTTAAASITISLAGTAEEPTGATAALATAGLGGFLIRGTTTRLDICANDVQGLSHGISYYLKSLGARWLLPNDKWTVIPSRTNVRLIVDEVIVPDYKLFDYTGTGGFGSGLWSNTYPQVAINQTKINEWKRRLRYGAEFSPGKHVYQDFFSDPAIYGIIDAGSADWVAISSSGLPYPLRLPSGAIDFQAKINAGNPTAVTAFCNWTVAKMATQRLSTDKRLHHAVTVEPSDGYKWGENTAALVTAGVGDGSYQDQAWYIANQAAIAIEAAYPDGNVISLAYNNHLLPPSFALEPNVIVQVTPYAFSGSLDPEILIANWGVRASRMAMYDYWTIPDWLYDAPVFNYLTIAERMRVWNDSDIEGINAESTFGSGAMGIGHYVASHLRWDLDIDEDALIDEWYDLAFGIAKAPMIQMLERWVIMNTAFTFVLIASELALSYADLEDALALAAGDAAVTARVLDFGRYVHYLRLRYELANTPIRVSTHVDYAANVADRNTKALALAKFLLEIDDSRMVMSNRIIELTTARYPFYPVLTAQYGVPQKTVTITIASPAVVTWVGHTIANDRPVWFSKTGALPTGIIAGTVYWVINAATDTFQIAATPGGAAINTSGTQSGVHTGRTQKPGWDELVTRTTTNPWATLYSKPDEDIEALIVDGVTTYPISDFTRIAFTGALTPVSPITWSDPGNVWGTIMKTISVMDIFVYIPTGLTAIPLKVNRQVANAIAVTRMSNNTVIDSASITALTVNDWTTLSLGSSLVPGEIIKITFRPTGARATGYFQFQTKPGVPLVMRDFLSPKHQPSVRLYFYVPTGQTKIVMFYPLGDYDGGFGFKFYNPSSVLQTVEYRDNRRTLILTVPPGQDDAIWSLERSVSPNEPMLMLTCPQAFSLEPGVLLVPADAL